MIEHPQWSKKSVIYEVNIRQYTKEGTIKAFLPHIERLHNMGVDILWIMPIFPIGETNRKGSLGSYYSIKNYTDINPELGTFNDFIELIETAHKLEMYIILDWVANHTAWDHNWIHEHSNWYKKDSNGKIISPQGWDDVAQLDFSNNDLQNEMINSMNFWINKTNIDGFRCDMAMLVPTTFWNKAKLKLNETKHIFMLAEAELPELNISAFNGCYAWEIHHKMEQVVKQNLPTEILNNQILHDSQIFPKETYKMQFTSNHDENSWNGTEYKKMGDGVMLAAVLTFLIPGIPLIYNGQEAMNKKRLLFFEKDEINWGNIELHDFYKNLIELKHQNAALWNGNFGGSYKYLETSNKNNVFAFIRKKDDNKVIFIGNMSPNHLEININFDDNNGFYFDWFTKEKVEFKTNNNFVLKPWQYNIFTI